MKCVDEDESEHTRLMKEQEEYEKQSMYEMPNIDDMNTHVWSKLARVRGKEM